MAEREADALLLERHLEAALSVADRLAHDGAPGALRIARALLPTVRWARNMVKLLGWMRDVARERGEAA